MPVFNTVGGANTHVVLEFPGEAYLYMGSIITLSYQVYRSKAPVFNMGEPTVDGFAIGNKYVAGTIISTMFSFDEITGFVKNLNSKEIKHSVDQINNTNGSLKRMHTFMKDDAASFNIHVIFSSEYHNDESRIIIYDATFINNGQVMSINDLITEQTASFVARDIREQHSVNDSMSSYSAPEKVRKASSFSS